MPFQTHVREEIRQLIIQTNDEEGTVGPPGPQGEQGDPGTPGTPGTNGNPGATGDTGPTGDTGATGDTGETGATGDDGEDGVQPTDLLALLNYACDRISYLEYLIGATDQPTEIITPEQVSLLDNPVNIFK